MSVASAPPIAAAGFASGTSLPCFNSSAPVGWTKQVVHNDKAVRLVTGVPASGGTVAFSTVFGKTATDPFTLTSTEMPGHTHKYGSGLLTDTATSGSANRIQVGTANTSSGTGSDGAHSHGMDVRVQYVDMIMINKD